jgi:hypothetical protein
MALLMEAVCTSETSGYSNQTARRNIQKAVFFNYLPGLSAIFEMDRTSLNPHIPLRTRHAQYVFMAGSQQWIH